MANIGELKITHFHNITEKDLIQAIESASNSNAVGPDGVPYFYWKQATTANSITFRIILMFFNKFFKKIVFSKLMENFLYCSII